MFEKYLGNISHIVAGLSAGLVCFSVVHDYSYFSIVSKKYFSMMGVWDHVSSSLENTLLFFVGLVVSHVFGYVSDENNLGRGVRYLIPFFVYVLPASGVLLMVSSFFLMEDASFYQSLGFFLTTFSVVLAVMDFFRVNEKYRGLAFQIGLLVFVSYSSAQFDASRALYMDSSIEAKYINGESVYKVLKSFNLGFVAKEIGEDKVVVRSWDGKTQFESKFINGTQGWACRRYEVCFDL